VQAPPPPPPPGTYPPPPPGTLPLPPAAGYYPYGYPPAPVEGDKTGGLVPYKNPNALLAYYLAVFAIIPYLGIFLAPAAIVFGLRGWRYYQQYPVVKGAVHAWIGIIGGGTCCLFYFAYAMCLLLIPLLLATAH
jgi:hypothetical protein